MALEKPSRHELLDGLWDALTFCALLLGIVCLRIYSSPVGLAVGCLALVARMFVSTKMPTSGAVLERTCPTCSRSVPDPTKRGSVWLACPHCQGAVVNTLALTVEPAKGLVRLKRMLVVFCVLLFPGFLVAAAGLIWGLSALTALCDSTVEQIPGGILIGSLGTGAYGGLVAAAALFGRAAYRAPGQRLCAVAAAGALAVSLVLVAFLIVRVIAIAGVGPWA